MPFQALRTSFSICALALALSCGLVPSVAGAAGEEAASLSTAPPGMLQGTLDVPAGPGPFPIVVILAGSGPIDRNGNAGVQLHSNTYALMARALADKGIATLRYDKRGVAGSAAAMTGEKDLRFTTYVDDAVAWIAKLRADKRFDRVFVAGHSEGSLLGILAAERAPLEGFISLEGAGRPIAAVLHEQIAARAPNLLAQSDAIAAQLQRGQSVDDVPDDLAPLYRPDIQPYLMSWFKYDPAVEIAKLKIPVTIVQGDADIQIGAGDAKLLATGDPHARLDIVPGLSHPLKHVAGVAAEQQGPAYSDPALPIDPAVVQAIVDLVARKA